MIDPSEAYKKSQKRSPKELDDRLLSAAHIEAARNADANKSVGFNWMPSAAFGVVCILGISIVLNNGIDQIEGDIAYFEEASLLEQPAPSVADFAAPALEEIVVTASRQERAIEELAAEAELAVEVQEVELFALAQEAFSDSISFDSVEASAASIPAAPLLPEPANLIDLASYIPELVLDIRYFGTNNFVGEPIDGYLSAKAIVSEAAALRLVLVQQQARLQGLGLKIFDAYRPQQAVYHFVRWAVDIEDQQTKADYYPNVDKSELFEQGYIASQSSHSRASTVDVTLINLEEGTELDMGTAFDFFDPRSRPSSTEVSEQAQQNRQLLRSLMYAQGFVPYEAEWWHFTYVNEPYPDRYFNMPVE